MSETLWVKSEFRRPTRRAMVWDEAKNRYIKATDPDTNQPVIERLPQVGFIGNDLKNLKPTPLRNRALQVLTREGNIIFVPLTEAASVQVSEAQMAAALKNCNRLGRIRVGTCPIREVFSGLRASSLMAPMNQDKDARPCDESDLGFDDEGRPLAPCKHFLAEQKARRSAQAARNAASNSAQREDAAKQMDAIHGQTDALTKVAESTAALVQHLAAKEAPAPKDQAKK